MKKLIFGAIVALSAALLVPTSAQANPTLPAPQTWTNVPLQEMLRVSGNISLSISGSGFLSQTGTIAVEKPANSTVIAAYLTSATWTRQNDPSVTLEGQPVTFTHHAESVTYPFKNHFADVTSLVKNTIDTHAPGTFTLSLDEGTSPLTSASVDGEELVVIFEDPSKGASTAIIMFGASPSDVDSSFSVSFPALSDLTAQKATLSLGIGFSNQSNGIAAQSSSVKISTNSQPTLQTVSTTAGGGDDGANTAGGLITVGGIGDSLALPANSSAIDDELYGLNSFLAAGDTSLTLTTRSPNSAADNVFQAVFYFEGVAAQGAVATQAGSNVAPVNNNTPSSAAPELANTGMNNSLFMASGALGMSLIILGGVMIYARRMQSNQNS